MIRHFCLDIEGGIANAKELKGCINVDGRKLETVAEVRKFLRSQLAMGRKFLPCGRCSNFDYQTGCKGHEHPEKWLKLKSIGLRNPNTDGKIEVISFIEDKGLNFHRGNAVKYIVRAGKKNPGKEVEDLQKAVWYLNREIERLRRGNK